MPADSVQSPRPGPVEPERVEDAFLTSPQLKALKIAVVVMGVILIVGFGVIVARIFYLTSNRLPPRIAPDTPAMLPAPLAEQRLRLPAGAVVQSLTLAGNRLAVHHRSDAVTEAITILDLATGAVVSRIAIERVAP